MQARYRGAEARHRVDSKSLLCFVPMKVLCYCGWTTSIPHQLGREEPLGILVDKPLVPTCHHCCELDFVHH